VSCRYSPFLGYAVYNTIHIDYYDTFQEKAGKKAGKGRKISNKELFPYSCKKYKGCK
jgi:hypothetical protein